MISGTVFSIITDALSEFPESVPSSAVTTEPPHVVVPLERHKPPTSHLNGQTGRRPEGGAPFAERAATDAAGSHELTDGASRLEGTRWGPRLAGRDHLH